MRKLIICRRVALPVWRDQPRTAGELPGIWKVGAAREALRSAVRTTRVGRKPGPRAPARGPPERKAPARKAPAREAAERRAPVVRKGRLTGRIFGRGTWPR